MRATHRITFDAVIGDSGLYWWIIGEDGEKVSSVPRRDEVDVEVLPVPWTDGDIVVLHAATTTYVWWRENGVWCTDLRDTWSPDAEMEKMIDNAANMRIVRRQAEA